VNIQHGLKYQGEGSATGRLDLTFKHGLLFIAVAD
jgi:hypothetical protein